MCNESDEFKLCSCENVSLGTKNNYLILRRARGKNIYIIGDTFMSPLYFTMIDNASSEVISSLLNSHNRFDSNVELEENDLLSLYFKFSNNLSFPNKNIQVHFKYKRGKWVSLSKTPNNESSLDEISSGYIHEPNDHMF